MSSETVFPDVPQWPAAVQSGELLASGRDARLDNQPPLEERIVLEFTEDLDREGITARINELLASAERAPEKCASAEIAGGMGDLCKQARDVVQRIDAAREKHNRPLLNSQRSLKGRADGIVAPLNGAIAKIRARLDEWTTTEHRRLEDERRRQEEAQRIAEEASRTAVAAAGLSDVLPEPQRAPPPRVEAPVARGDLGARVGTTTRWHHEIQSVRQLPDRILKNPRVVEAIDKVIAAEIRGGAREIKGARIWSSQQAAVR